MRKEALAAENARLRREAAAVDAVIAELLQLQDRDRVLQMIVEKTCDLVDAEISYIALAYPSEREVRVCVTHGDHSGELKHLAHSYGDGLGGKVAETGVPLLVDNWFKQMSPASSEPARILSAEGIVSAMCAPMRTSRGLVGVLYAASRHEASFSQQQLDTLQRLGISAALAIENARLYDEQRKAVHDLQENVATHEQFLQLVLDDAGVHVIGETLAMLLDARVMIEDAEGRILCNSMAEGGPEQDPQSTDLLATLKVLRLPQYEKYLDSVENSQHIVDIPEVDSTSTRPLHRLVAPIIAGRRRLGYVTVVVDDSHMKSTRSAAIEQAAIVAALALKRQEAARTELLQRTLQAQENERMRIARELHDETSQAISALQIALDTARLALPQSRAKAEERLDVARAIAENLLDGVHRATADLRPTVLDDLGLRAALAWYGQTRLEPVGISMELESDERVIRLPAAVETTVFRIAQEALTNVVRHSGASNVRVSLHAGPEDLTLSIVDNGRGFDADNLDWEDPLYPAYGLRGMKERAEILGGTLSIVSSKGEGTSVHMWIPLETTGR